jgi:hypothetical protein
MAGGVHSWPIKCRGRAEKLSRLESMNASVKAQTGVVEKLESKMGRLNEIILKLQQEIRGTVKK